MAAFVKDAATTWTFELQPDTVSSSALLSQLQTQGMRGFRFAGPYVVGGTAYNLYRKDTGSATTYTYNVLPAALSSVDFLAQANAQGANRYYATGATYGFGTSNLNNVQLYEQAVQGNSSYAYEVLARPGTDADLLAQLNAEGARGYRFRSAFVFTDGTRTVYEKDTSQAATFTFFGRTPQPNSTAYIMQANAEGANGNVLVGDYVYPSGTTQTLYMTPANCTGFLCRTRNLFGF